MERLRPKWFFAILLVSSLGLLVFMVSILYDLTRTEKEIIDRYLSRPMGVLHAEVTAYFRPMFLAINSAAGHHQKGIYDQSNLSATCKYFSTLVQTHPEIESVGIADMRGNELDLLHSEGNWETRMVSPKSGSSTWMKWNSACNEVDSVWSGTFTRPKKPTMVHRGHAISWRTTLHISVSIQYQSKDGHYHFQSVYKWYGNGYRYHSVRRYNKQPLPNGILHAIRKRDKRFYST